MGSSSCQSLAIVLWSALRDGRRRTLGGGGSGRQRGYRRSNGLGMGAVEGRRGWYWRRRWGRRGDCCEWMGAFAELEVYIFCMVAVQSSSLIQTIPTSVVPKDEDFAHMCGIFSPAPNSSYSRICSHLPVLWPSLFPNIPQHLTMPYISAPEFIGV